MDAEKLQEIIKDHKLWLEGKGGARADLRKADLCGVNLRRANLSEAVLRDANLVGADIDFSVLPLYCGWLKWEIDWRIAAQLMYHICSMKCGDPGFIDIQNKALAYANRSHLVKLYGELSPVETER